MSNRNLTELFYMLRNNVLYNKNIYSDGKNSDNEILLERTRNDNSICETPNWIGKYDEAHYLLTKIKQKIEDLLKIQETKVRLVLSETSENDTVVEDSTKDISKLISSCHNHIKSMKLISRRGNNNLEIVLLDNVEKNLLMMLQSTTEKFRTSQNAYLNEKDSLEKRSRVFFENISSGNGENAIESNSVETFDNFLNMDTPQSKTNANQNTDAYLDDEERLDEYFQMPASHSLTQRKLLMIESDNTRMIENREEEVVKIVNSIVDLNVVFKDLSQLVQEQGTILDRIDYNIESTQTKVYAGYRQLQKAEKYQRKNKKMYCILILAIMIMFMIVLMVFSKF